MEWWSFNYLGREMSHTHWCLWVTPGSVVRVTLGNLFRWLNAVLGIKWGSARYKASILTSYYLSGLVIYFKDRRGEKAYFAWRGPGSFPNTDKHGSLCTTRSHTQRTAFEHCWVWSPPPHQIPFYIFSLNSWWDTLYLGGNLGYTGSVEDCSQLLWGTLPCWGSTLGWAS